MNRRRVALVLLCAALGAGAQSGEDGVFEWGFEQRVRNENWNNATDWTDQSDDQRVQVRYRTRMWLDGPVTSNIGFHVGLNQETNQILTPDRPAQFDEVFFETAYLDFKKLFVDGLSLKVGRQNVTKGEGFVLLEGTSGDGSRTIFSNAAVLGYTRKKSKIELIGILNPYTERFLPKIHNRHRQLTEWDEQAVGTYYTDNNLKNTTLDAYYFYKKETGDRRAPANVQYQPDRHIHTAGGRAVRDLGRGWSLRGECALQWGAEHPNVEVRGWGGYGYARKSFSGDRQYVQAGYWGMSGDDPKTTGRVEAWDPLFSRWPKWSELYIYSLMRETGASYWTNLSMWQTEWGFTPCKRVQGRVTYYWMKSFHPFQGSSATFGSGTVRGSLPEVRVDVALNKNWKGHVVYEHLAPGSFYSTRAHAYFLRFEMIYTIGGKFAAGHGN